MGVGPFITAKSLERLKGYCGHPPLFDSFEDAKTYFQRIYSPFCLSDEEWNFLVRHSIEKGDDNKYKMRYDPKITFQLMNMEAQDLDSFDSVWKKISGPLIMLIRGETSDLLIPETVQKMKDCG